jgi:hypothetical protein
VRVFDSRKGRTNYEFVAHSAEIPAKLRDSAAKGGGGHAIPTPAPGIEGHRRRSGRIGASDGQM